MTESELYHHGIKGQKWGVRRFQNPDGTLTAAGKKHVAQRSSGSKFNSSGGTDLTQLGSSGGGGGGGGSPLDEEDQKKLEEGLEELLKNGEPIDETDPWPALSKMNLVPDEMSDRQLNECYDKIREHNRKVQDKDFEGREWAGNAAATLYEANQYANMRDDKERRSSGEQVGKKPTEGVLFENPKSDLHAQRQNKVTGVPGWNNNVKKMTLATGALGRKIERVKKEEEERRKKKSAQHSFQAPSESELYHCFGPLFQTEEKIEYSALELYHHGIKGQKWGVRRFQNEDGTLTAAGRKHVAQKSGSRFNSAGGTDLTKLGSSGGGGGGGAGEPLDEEDQKRLDDLYEQILKNVQDGLKDGMVYSTTPGGFEMSDDELDRWLRSSHIDTDKLSKGQIENIRNQLNEFDEKRIELIKSTKQNTLSGEMNETGKAHAKESAAWVSDKLKELDQKAKDQKDLAERTKEKKKQDLEKDQYDRGRKRTYNENTSRKNEANYKEWRESWEPHSQRVKSIEQAQDRGKQKTFDAKADRGEKWYKAYSNAGRENDKGVSRTVSEKKKARQAAGILDSNLSAKRNAKLSISDSVKTIKSGEERRKKQK